MVAFKSSEKQKVPPFLFLTGCWLQLAAPRLGFALLKDAVKGDPRAERRGFTALLNHAAFSR